MTNEIDAPDRQNQNPKATTIAVDGGGMDLFVFSRTFLEDMLDFWSMSPEHANVHDELCRMYRPLDIVPNFSHFRVGPNMLRRTRLDWIVSIGKDTETGACRLAAHGIMAGLFWNGRAKDLPRGWQGAVLDAYRNENHHQQETNTKVGLFIKVEDRFRNFGLSEIIINKMRTFCAENTIQRLIIPLRPPLRYEKRFAQMPFMSFASLKRPDGRPLDYWVRLHTKLGAKIIDVFDFSHQHAIPYADFMEIFEVDAEFTSTGDYLARMNDEWYNVHFIRDHQICIVNQGCVWVEHKVA